MKIHLSRYDVVALVKGARTSIQLSDEGEAFAEEALGCFEEEELEHIEDEFGSPLEEFFVEIFERWDEEEPSELPILLMDALADLDIEMTYEESDEEDDEEWEDDYDEPIDDSFEGF